MRVAQEASPRLNLPLANKRTSSPRKAALPVERGGEGGISLEDLGLLLPPLRASRLGRDGARVEHSSLRNRTVSFGRDVEGGALEFVWRGRRGVYSIFMHDRSGMTVWYSSY